MQLTLRIWALISARLPVTVHLEHHQSEFATAAHLGSTFNARLQQLKRVNCPLCKALERNSGWSFSPSLPFAPQFSTHNHGHIGDGESDKLK